MPFTSLRHVWGYMDAEWYCVDLNHRVAFLTTGGYSNETLEALIESKGTKEFARVVRSLPDISRSLMVNENGEITDWIAMSQRGLYGFDYVDGEIRDRYMTITRPDNPLILSAEMSALLPTVPVEFHKSEFIEVASWEDAILKHLGTKN